MRGGLLKRAGLEPRGVCAVCDGPGALPFAGLADLCPACFKGWQASAERRRAMVAMADFINRRRAERRNGG